MRVFFPVLFVGTLAAALVIWQPRSDANSDFKAAGCFIPTPDGVVLGINRLLDAVQIPIGSRKANETPQQTAARETQEEIGLDVDVGRLVRTFEDGMVYLFLCHPKEPIKDYTQLRPQDTLEVSEVLVLDPVTMVNYDGRKITNAWRFPDNRPVLIELLKKDTY
ncbi:MAG: NUDIX hydrolase [Acidiferrobacterales bacterium]